MLKGMMLPAAILLCTSAASAQITFESVAPVAPPAKAQESKDSSRMICQHEETVGSRLGGVKVCMTARQWAEKRDGNREDVDKAQRVQLTAPPIPENSVRGAGCC